MRNRPGIGVAAMVSAALLLAACKTQTTTTTAPSFAPQSASPSAASTPTAMEHSPTPPAASALPSPPASAPASPAALIQTANATVAGKQEAILAGASGLSLYYRTTDLTVGVLCSAACASVWPPLLLQAGNPTSATPLPGKLGVVTGANGRQVTYNGHPLYHYSGDKAAGQVNGQGIGQVWFVATPDLK